MNVVRRLFSVGSYPGYTKLPLQEHYIQLLVKEGLQEHQAKELTTVLDNQVRQKLYIKSGRYLSGKDYVQMMKRYEESINSFRQNIFAAQLDIMQSLRQDFTSLEQEIGQSQVTSGNETKQLESGIQLDLNFEGKRRAETKEEIDRKTETIGGYMEEQLNTIQDDLGAVSKQARAAIFTFGSVAFASLLLYHASSAS